MSSWLCGNHRLEISIKTVTFMKCRWQCCLSWASMLVNSLIPSNSVWHDKKQVNIGSDNGLVPNGTKTLSKACTVDSSPKSCKMSICKMYLMIAHLKSQPLLLLPNELTLKQLEILGCVLNTVANDAWCNSTRPSVPTVLTKYSLYQMNYIQKYFESENIITFS